MEDRPTPPSAQPDNTRLLLLDMFLTGKTKGRDPRDPMAFLDLINATLKQATAEVELLTALRDLEMVRLADSKEALVERIGARCGMSKGWVSQHNAVTRGGGPQATIERILAEQATEARRKADDPETPDIARMVARTRAQNFSTVLHRWMERFNARSGAAAFIPFASIPTLRGWVTTKAAALTSTGGTAGVASAAGTAAVAVPTAALTEGGLITAAVAKLATAAGTTATVAATGATAVTVALAAPVMPVVADTIIPDLDRPAATQTPTPALTPSPVLSPSPTNDSPTTAGVGKTTLPLSPEQITPTPTPPPPTPTSAPSTAAPLPTPTVHPTQTPYPAPTIKPAPTDEPAQAIPGPASVSPTPAPAASSAPATPAPVASPAVAPQVSAPPQCMNGAPPDQSTSSPACPATSDTPTGPPPTETPPTDAASPARTDPTPDTGSGNSLEGAALGMEPFTGHRSAHSREMPGPLRTAVVPYAWGYEPAPAWPLVFSGR
ncbi:hypothetical protein [Streptosporangium sp. NPDC051022]|uniref:hypothetical protein n=1 Tax=Streptosporangium sp. NPDC051022 TaxID=3155752 RepID=UPI003443013F